jgi:hypothetical protein
MFKLALKFLKWLKLLYNFKNEGMDSFTSILRFPGNSNKYDYDYPIFFCEIGSLTGIVFQYLVFQVILIFRYYYPIQVNPVNRS